MLRTLALALIAGGAAAQTVKDLVWHTTLFPTSQNRVDAEVPSLNLVPVSTLSIETGRDADPTERGAAEFLKYVGNGLVAVCDDVGQQVKIFELSADGIFTLVHSLPASPLNIANGLSATPQSVTVGNGVLVVAVDNGKREPNAGNVDQHGSVSFFDVSTLTTATEPLFEMSVLGYLPDHLSFSPDYSSLQVAVEAEPNSDVSFDGVGGVTIFRSSNNDWTDSTSISSTFVGFDAFNGRSAELLSKGVQMPMVVLKPGTTVAQALEPEYITYSSDSTTAYVACQEANAIAVLDLATNAFTDIWPLGFRSMETLRFDVSDRDGPGGGTLIGNQKAWANVWSMFQPDTMHTIRVGGKDYIVTANEGDSQDYDGTTEEERVRDLDLDPTAFPNAATLQATSELGRLKVTTTRGLNNESEYTQLFSYGARSVSIVDAATGDLVWDSGNMMEVLMMNSTHLRPYFNSQGDAADADTRSDDKGVEAEGLAVGTIDGRTYIFAAAERASVIFVRAAARARRAARAAERQGGRAATRAERRADRTPLARLTRLTRRATRADGGSASARRRGAARRCGTRRTRRRPSSSRCRPCTTARRRPRTSRTPRRSSSCPPPSRPRGTTRSSWRARRRARSTSSRWPRRRRGTCARRRRARPAANPSRCTSIRASRAVCAAASSSAASGRTCRRGRRPALSPSPSSAPTSACRRPRPTAGAERKYMRAPPGHQTPKGAHCLPPPPFFWRPALRYVALTPGGGRPAWGRCPRWRARGARPTPSRQSAVRTLSSSFLNCETPRESGSSSLPPPREVTSGQRARCRFRPQVDALPQRPSSTRTS